ncbi:MAG: T9SS type A sorting domain-containing protein [Flavobacteriales bacterium]|nr:T9SS type A sorting domain-containing protein [Flavobacteriales bacterium]
MQLLDPIRTQLLDATVTSGNLAGRQYVTHTYDGNVGSNDANEWSFLWVPSDTLTGEVGIYVTVVVANEDQEVTDDYVYTDTLFLAQIPLSVAELEKEAIRVYPTLVTDVLTVLAKETTEITIYDLQGRQVYTHGNSKKHDLSNLSTGQYIYLISDDTGVLITGKFIRK